MNYWYLLPPVAVTIFVLLTASHPKTSAPLVVAVVVGVALGAWLAWSYNRGEVSACHHPRADYITCKDLYGWYPPY